VYSTKSGDYLSLIADQFGVDLTAVLSFNPEINNPNLIFVGQAIRIPDR